MGAVLSFGPLCACGDRTGLLVPVVFETENPDSASSGSNSGSTSGSSSGDDDAGDDATTVADALPPVDVTVPPDAFNDCPDAGSTFIYLVGIGEGLYSFYPPTVTFRRIGTLSCPDPSGGTPFSMAVDRTGTAYVLYSHGALFRVSTATAACEPTPFVSGQAGFDARFGMGYSRDTQDTGETLYVIGETGDLATIDTTNFSLHRIAPVAPTVDGAELTGTGGGDLFAFYASTGALPCSSSHTCRDSAIGQINKATGQQTNESVLTGVSQGQAWAFSFWGGDFYTFTEASVGGTRITRYRPTDGSIVTVAQRSDFRIVGAGVSTCAPAR
jgi:hypothetical protein